MDKIKRFFKYLSHFLLSKYGFAIIFLAFAVWVCFFDINSIKGQRQIARENLELKNEIETNKKIIAEKQSQIKALSDSIEFIEKYAREHYQMQAENEDVFLLKK